MEDFLSTESMLFELFRYSFQYSMEREPKPITETSTKAESVIVELLETNISEIANRISFLTLHQSNKFFKMMNLFLDKDLTGDIKRYERTKKLNFVFPPCWNSIVGLRGIAIKCNTFSEVKILSKSLFNLNYNTKF